MAHDFRRGLRVKTDDGYKVFTSQEDYDAFQKEQAESAEIDATDGAKELAEANDIDLSTVEGSGKDGRITKPDVEAFLED